MSTDHAPVFCSTQKKSRPNQQLYKGVANLAIPSFQMKSIYKEKNKKKEFKCRKGIFQ